MENVNRLSAYMLIKHSKGKFIRANFIKKNGEKRAIVFRTGVKKGVNGHGMSWEPDLKLLMPVYDIHKKDWRMLNLDTLNGLRINGVDFCVTG